MKIFYATFMQKQAFKNHYVKLTAIDEPAASKCMFEHFGDKWMTVYKEEEFDKQITDFGLTELVHIMCIEHGNRPGYSVEYRLQPSGVDPDAMMYAGDD